MFEPFNKNNLQDVFLNFEAALDSDHWTHDDHKVWMMLLHTQTTQDIKYQDTGPTEGTGNAVNWKATEAWHFWFQ